MDVQLCISDAGQNKMVVKKRAVHLHIALLFCLPFANVCAAQKTANETVVPGGAWDDRHPVWSPDGTQIAFESNRDGNWEIYVVQPDGSGAKNISANPAADRRPSWSADGRKIIFDSDREGGTGLVVHTFQTASSQRIAVPGLKNVCFPVFRPSGKSAVFSAVASPKADNFNIFELDFRSGALKQLTTDTTRSLYASFSKNGKKMVFFSRRDTKGTDDELYLFNYKNKKVKRITRRSGHDFCPTLSPDGKKVACAASEGSARPELVVHELKTGRITQLTFNSDGDTEPHWAPDGKRLCFAGFRAGNYRVCILQM
jgi:TolB protein